MDDYTFLKQTLDCKCGRDECSFIQAKEAIEELEASLAEAREALTPSGSTKYAYSGEFKFTEAMGFDDDGSEIYQKITVPWTTIKEIMAAIRHRALKGTTDG